MAVIEDLGEFNAWLSMTPLAVWASHKRSDYDQRMGKPAQKAPSNEDADFLAALKSMA